MVETVRGLVRPVVTLGLVGSVVIAAFHGILDPQYVAAMATTAVGYWFADRSNQKAGE